MIALCKHVLYLVFVFVWLNYRYEPRETTPQINGKREMHTFALQPGVLLSIRLLLDRGHCPRPNVPNGMWHDCCDMQHSG